MSDPQDRQRSPADGAPSAADFADQFRPLLREVFAEIARRELLGGGDAVAQAHAYAERGKPDYALAYLLVSELPDAEKREIYAHSHERRAALTEQRARQFSQQFHRPFPLLFNDAAKDRSLARQIRLGRGVQPGAGRHLPTI